MSQAQIVVLVVTAGTALVFAGIWLSDGLKAACAVTAFYSALALMAVGAATTVAFIVGAVA